MVAVKPYFFKMAVAGALLAMFQSKVIRTGLAGRETGLRWTQASIAEE